MKRILFSLLLLVLVQLQARAQFYVFSQTTATYTNLVSPTVISGTRIWDDTSLIVPIGFPFKFGATTHSDIQITSNGVLFFNTGGTEAAIVAYDADFASLGTTISTSPVGYELTGTPGNRIFKVEWKNTGFYDGSGADFANIQVWIYEGNYRIETRIGPSSFANPSAIFGMFGGPANGIATSIDLTTEILTGMFIQGSPGAATAVSLNNATVYPFLNAPPSNGTVYRYSALVSGLSEKLNNSRITVYPNPVADFLQIDGLSAIKGNVSIKIYDVLSNVVLTQKTTSGKQAAINVANLNKGTYFVEITAGKARAGKQFLKL